MPRYFFHVIDGTLLPDRGGTELPDRGGTELPDLQAARAMAIRTSGEILCSLGERFWDGTEWHLEVADEEGHVLLTLHFLVEQEPARFGGGQAQSQISHLRPLK